MRNYAIDSEDGNALTTGLQESEVRGSAQRLADDTGKTVTVYSLDGAEDDAGEWQPAETWTVSPTRESDADALARGVRRLDAVRLASGAWAYFDDGMGLWYVADEDEVRSLALDYLDSPDPAIQGDAYSHWCAGVVALEATAEQIAEVTT